MIRVALVGNIASGKSTVEKFLAERGYIVLDTDVVCHNLLSLYKNTIIEAFKLYDIKNQSGDISREKLGKLVFSDKYLKRKLENIIHPLVKEYILDFFKKHKDEKFVFVSVPLLFEAGMEDLFDKIIFIYSEDGLRLQRLLKRNNYTMEYAKRRLASQASQEVKMNQSDFILNNNSTLKCLEDNVSKLIEQIR